MKACCANKNSVKQKGFWQGILFGIIPHSFCILFIIFSALGAAFATEYIKKFLLVPHFFTILVLLSVFFAVIVAGIYLYRTKALNLNGLICNRNYLMILFASTIILNLVFVYGIFPAIANMDNSKKDVAYQDSELSVILIEADIPCPGHAPLIISEVKKLQGISNTEFIFPDKFKISYNKNIINENEIINLEIFSSFKAKKI